MSTAWYKNNFSVFVTGVKFLYKSPTDLGLRSFCVTGGHPSMCECMCDTTGALYGSLYAWTSTLSGQ